MKHIIESDNFGRAWCKRPGCGASLEGGIVRDMSVREIRDNFFSTDNCPAVFSRNKEVTNESTLNEKVEYLTNYALKEIASWQKLINYWHRKIK